MYQPNRIRHDSRNRIAKMSEDIKQISNKLKGTPTMYLISWDIV